MAERLKLVEIGVAGIAVGGLLAALDSDAVCRAVLVRRHRGAVRPDQIRHPARSSGALRTARRQRPDRKRDLHCDPARHHRGRARGQGGAEPGVVCERHDGLRRRVLDRGPNDPTVRTGARPTSSSTSTSLRSTFRAAAAPLRLNRGCGGAASSRAGSGSSARWCCRFFRRWSRTCSAATRAVITAFLAVFAVAIAIGSALASWLAHGRIVLFPTLLAAVLLGDVCARPRLGHLGRHATANAIGLAEVFGSARGLRVAIDLAGLAIAGGLFIVPAFSAVQAWAGADRRARIVAAVNVLNAAFMTVGRRRRCRSCRKPARRRRCCSWRSGVANFVAAVVIARTMPTSPLRDFLRSCSGPLPARGSRARERRQGRPASDHRAQPCELSRRRDRALCPRAGSDLRHRPRHRPALVGEAVPPAYARHAARSDQTDGDAHTDQRGQRRRDADHLPRGAHHRNRQPDESL